MPNHCCAMNSHESLRREKPTQGKMKKDKFLTNPTNA